MKIYWYVNDENDKSIDNWETEGELPRVGDVLYLHDRRERGQKSSRYKVKMAYHSIDLERYSTTEVPREAVAGKTEPEERFQAICDNIEKNFEVNIFRLNWQGKEVHAARRRGEVILEKIER